MKSPVRIFGLLSAVLFFLSTFAPPSARAQTVVVLNDFEDGTPQGWVPRGGGVVLTNTDAAGSRPGGVGARSLRTTNRTFNFHGPSLNTLGLLTRGATYQVTVWARLVAGQAPTTMLVTMQRSVGAANSFDTIAQSAANGVTDAAWVQMTGLYAFGGTDPTGLLLYVEAANPTAAYYIDDFRIDKISDPPGPPPNTTGLSSTFETGTSEGWAARIGPEVVAPSTDDAHTGTFSLLTTNRTSAFRGPNFNVTNVMFNGSRYRVSLWAKLLPGSPATQLRVSLQRNAGTVTTFHTVITNTTVTPDAWVRLVTNYDVALANSSLFLYVESSGSLASFYVDDIQVTYLPPPTIEPDIASLKDVLADSFPVGASVTNLEVSGVHGDLLKKHFNSLVSGNDMKWDATEPNPGSFNFTNADQQVAFAQANDMLVRGHTLLWHQQTPAWVFTDPNTGTTMLPSPENRALLLTRLENHIRGVVPHFGSKVYAWDVVNEVIDESQPDCMRRSTWFNVTGTDFLDTAFRVAREVAPPGTLLFINDYNSTIPNKRQCLYDVVVAMQARGVPVDGVGHQMHDNVEFPSAQTMTDTLDLFAGLGLTQHVTEMDVSVYSGSFSTPVAQYDEIPADRFLLQARHYRDFMRVFKAHKHQLTSVTFWGLADDNTWLTRSGRVDGPLLFDDQLKHKLAYTAIVSPQDLPRTPASVTLSNLIQTYDGGPHAASAATSPVGLTVDVTYDGSVAQPVNAGSYGVVATIDSEDYVGSATGTLVIEPAAATIVLGGLGVVYDGLPHAATVTTDPPAVAVALTYNGSPAPPTNVGSYAVEAVVSDPNYVGSASATLTITQAAAVVTLSGLTQLYDGSPKSVTVTTAPPGLGVAVTYDGSSTPPTAPGSYDVTATVVDANYTGSASATFVITTTALVRHAPSINGRLKGSVQVLSGESLTLNGGAVVSGDLLVPGTPKVRQNGRPSYGGTLDGDGASTPSGYTITLNGGASLRHVVRRTDPVAFPTVAAPPLPSAKRNVTINHAGQKPGSFATIRNLTLNGCVSQVAVPAGTYGVFTANGNAGFTLGVAGATTPSVYNFQGLTLNGGSRLQVVGPVIVTLAGGMTINASVGNTAHPEWLSLSVAAGGVTLNGGASLFAFVTAPSGTVMLNATLNGRVVSDRLTINGGAALNTAP